MISFPILPFILCLFSVIIAYRVFVTKTKFIKNKDSGKTIFKVMAWICGLTFVLFIFGLSEAIFPWIYR